MELTSITSAARAPTGKLSGVPFIAYKLNKKAFRRSERRILPAEFSFCSDAGWRPAEMFNLALESVPIYPVPVGFKGTCKRIYRLQVL